MQPDFDFKTRTGHLRGFGWRGLLALVIHRVSLGVAIGVAGTFALKFFGPH